MSTVLARLRSEVEGELQPPVDVLIDPSLLVASTACERLSNSGLFDAQSQATLGQRPTQPRVDGLYVPSTFRQLLETTTHSDPSATQLWNFYRGQAEAATPATIIELLDSNDITSVDERTRMSVNWSASLDAAARDDRLIETLEETCAFLAEGGVLLTRTPASLNAIRDGGVASITLGQADIESDVRDRLTDVGYQDPAPICAFGVGNVAEVTDAIVGDLLASHGDLLLYRFGR